MASTNKTTNLGLNQWVLSDPFLMEDMNADNRKIDAALGLSPWVKLMDITTQAAAANVEINLSGITLSQYLSLRVYVVSNNTRSNLNLRINKATSAYCWWSNYAQSWQSTSSYTTEGGYVDIDLTAAVVFMDNGRQYSKYTAITPMQITTLDFYDSGNIPIGTRYIVMGVKK